MKKETSTTKGTFIIFKNFQNKKQKKELHVNLDMLNC